MTIGIVAATRNARLDAITSAIGSSGLLRIYDGSRPATGGAATTLLAELALSVTAAPGASGGVLTFNAITQDSSANATGTASWFRLSTSGGTAVVDGSVTATGGGGDLQLVTTSIVSTQPVSVTSLVLTEGNA